ncbi:MAG: pilin [Archangium sp.]|nr:pilin [Archangium sp.]MDP3152660.1 pilin [Archangium sp.]MDP3575897.1 pilin [Archangium sp.]
MTPQPLNAPVKPSALPLVALILGVFGFCIPPLFPIAIILAIVSLVKSGEPAFAARKTLSIITLVMGLVYVPVVGILAAIAIPNFIRFQARSKQAECKSNLKSAYLAQKSYFAEKDVYGESAEEIGFRVEGRNRYAYRIGADSVLPATLTTTPTAELEAAALLEEVGVHGDAVTMTCAGNIDNDATLDVWSISSEQRNVNGEVVPPGTPFNHVNDVQD